MKRLALVIPLLLALVSPLFLSAKKEGAYEKEDCVDCGQP